MIQSRYVGVRYYGVTARASSLHADGEGRERLNGRNKARRAVIGSYYTYPTPPRLAALSFCLPFIPSIRIFSTVNWRNRCRRRYTLDLASSHCSHARNDVARLRYLTQCRAPRFLLFLFRGTVRRAFTSRLTLFRERPERYGVMRQPRVWYFDGAAEREGRKQGVEA